MVNRPEWVHAMFAIMQIGAVLVPVNTRFRTDDMAYVLGQSDAVAVILADRSGPVDYLGMMREVAPGLGARPDARFPALRHVIVLSDGAHADTLGWREMLENGRRVSDDALRERAHAVDPEQSAFVFYTSGTTGFPKGAVHDHRMVRNASDHGDRMGVTVDDVILMYLPLFHAFGFICGALMSMIKGARQVLTETFDADACVDLIVSEKATMIHGFDTHYTELLDAQDKNPRDVSSVRTGICGTGMASAIPIARRARQTFGNFMTGFGMSEIGIATLSDLDSTEEQCVEANGYPAPRLRGARRRSRDGIGPAGVRAGRDPRAQLHGHAGLLQEARGHGAGPRQGRVVSHRRHGGHALRRPPAVPRPLQGHAEDRRRERRSDGSRGVPHEPRRHPDGGGGRAARRSALRGGGGLRAARARLAR